MIDLPTLFQVLLDTWKSSSIKTVLQLRRMFECVRIIFSSLFYIRELMDACPCREVDINQDGILQFDEFRVLLDKVCGAIVSRFNRLSQVIWLQIQEHVAMNTMEEEADERRSTAGSSHSLLQMKLAPKIAVSTSAARRLYTEAVSLSDSGHVTEESFIRVAYSTYLKPHPFPAVA